MSKRIIFIILNVISIFCILYYTMKYYSKSSLVFNENNIILWTIIIIIITISLVIGILNSLKLNKVEKQNSKLLIELSYLSDINSIMERILDLDKGEKTNERMV